MFLEGRGPQGPVDGGAPGPLHALSSSAPPSLRSAGSGLLSLDVGVQVAGEGMWAGTLPLLVKAVEARGARRGHQ